MPDEPIYEQIVALGKTVPDDTWAMVPQHGERNRPTIEDMVRQHLHLHGYDGLCNPEEECGCNGDSPCAWPCFDECRAAYRHKDGGYYTEKEVTE